MKKIFYCLIAVPLLCLNMDKPIGSQEKKEVTQGPKKGISSIISLIKSGARLTDEEFLQLIKSNDVFMWDVNGPMIFTSTKLKKSDTQKKEPASLVSQATRAAARLPTKQVSPEFPQKFLLLDILLQQERPDLDRIAEWFKEYITRDKASTENIVKMWKKAIEQLSVAQSKKLLEKLAKGWFKGDKTVYRTLGINLIEALVEYQCNLRTELIKLFDNKELIVRINKIFDDLINQNIVQNSDMERKKKTIISLIKSSGLCKEYCREEIIKLLDIKN